MRERCKDCGGYHDNDKTNMAKSVLLTTVQKLQEHYDARRRIDQNIKTLEETVLEYQLVIFTEGER